MDARLQRIRLTPAQLTARRGAAVRPRVDGVKFVNFADFGTLGGATVLVLGCGRCTA